jgi:hypothetical protein
MLQGNCFGVIPQEQCFKEIIGMEKISCRKEEALVYFIKSNLRKKKTGNKSDP